MAVSGFASRACALSLDRGRCIYVIRRNGRVRFRLVPSKSRGDHTLGRAIGSDWFPGNG